jgi:hypothetical protein
MKIFQDAMKNGLKLADSKRPEEANRSDEPNFCPYHRLLGHTIENCWGMQEINMAKARNQEEDPCRIRRFRV